MREIIDTSQEDSHPGYELLSSGPEFFDDIIQEIESAQKYIVIKAFLWRNDEAGQRIADALKMAADRGVKVLIIKDRIGAFFEYGEGNGQSFFHDQPLSDTQVLTPHRLQTVYPQARVYSSFYKNGQMFPRKNPERATLTDHPNAEVIDQFKTYDHSKVIVVDGETAYLGGIGFGNEYATNGKKGYVDSMLKLNRERDTQALMHAISDSLGEIDKHPSINFLTDSQLGTGASLQEHALEFIEEAREQIQVLIPYLGQPEYINALGDAVNRGVTVELLMPKHSNTHGGRNEHFVKRLRRQTHNQDLLRVSQSPQMVHSKFMLRDEEAAFFGSHNLSHDEGVFDETNIQTEEPAIITPLQAQADRLFASSEPYAKSPSWIDILPISRAEYGMVKVQTLMRRLRAQEVLRARQKGRESILEIIDRYH